MPDIPSVGHGTVGPLERTTTPHARTDSGRPQHVDSPPHRPGDRVELSEHARLLDRLRQMPEVRVDRIDRIRQAIADGAYETDDKIDLTIQRLLEDLLIE